MFMSGVQLRLATELPDLQKVRQMSIAIYSARWYSLIGTNFLTNLPFHF